MVILPAIDLLEGRCVRLRQGDYAERTDYSDDPVAVAKEFETQGAKWLHVVDLDGAKIGRPVHLDVVRRICSETNLKVEFGGGLRDDAAIDLALATGIERVVLGTRLVGHFLVAEEIFARYGDRVIAGVDLKHGLVAIHGWTETAGLEGVAFAKTLVEVGAMRIIVTDVATDGMLEGPNLPMLEEMVRGAGVPVIASGGVSSLADLNEIALTGVEGAIIGRALYDGRLTIAEALQWHPPKLIQSE